MNFIVLILLIILMPFILPIILKILIKLKIFDSVEEFEKIAKVTKKTVAIDIDNFIKLICNWRRGTKGHL